jgi:hypothetical protein
VKANASSWETQPMPAERGEVPFERHLTEEEFERLAQGLVPESQDDRWFVWVDDMPVVHVYRSWTGTAMYEVELERAGDGYDVKAAWANRDPEQNSASPGLDVPALRGLFDQLARA